MKKMIAAAAAIAALVLASPVFAQTVTQAVPGVIVARSLVGPTTFNENFSTPCPVHCNFNALYPNWKTNFYFGDQSGCGGVSSREYGGVSNVMVDPCFLPDAFGPQAPNGNAYIYAYKFSPADAVAMGRPYGSQVLTTQHSFAQALGYWEIRAKLPAISGVMVSGTWPAFWLLPTAVTPTNGGRLSEIDIFEEFGGVYTIPGTKTTIDRRGQPLFTLHYGVSGNEQKISNWPNNPPAPIDATQFHVFGFLWTATTMTAYIDQVETFTAPNPGVVDPHYIVLSMDVGGEAGDPALGAYPAPLMIDYARVWSLP